jgi:2-dehydropantoate 2-reductase
VRIHIVGAGAIAGMAGAYMAMNGEEVTFVDQWDEHVEAINGHGLVIDGIRGRHHLSIRALRPDQLAEPLDLVFLGVKSQHTEAAMASIMPHLTPSATVVSLQNGFNAELIASFIGRERVIGTVPDYTAALVAPGQLEFTVEGPLYVGELDGQETARIQEIHRLLAMVSTAKITPNIIGRIWTKQCYISQIVMTAMDDVSMSAALADDRNKLLAVAIARETIAVADAAGVELESDDYFQPELIRQRTPGARQQQVDILAALVRKFEPKKAAEAATPGYTMVKKGSGMWWDIVYRRRPSEAPGLTGAVLERGRQLGVPTPVSDAMLEMIYAIERGERPLAWSNFDDLAKIAVAHGEPLSVNEE